MSRGARRVALPLRGGRPKEIQTGWWRVAVANGAIRLELVQPVQRHVESGADFVLPDGNFERSALGPHRHRLDAAVDPDAVLQVHYVVPRPERPGGCGGRGLAGAARPPQAARRPEA